MKKTMLGGLLSIGMIFVGIPEAHAGIFGQTPHVFGSTRSSSGILRNPIIRNGEGRRIFGPTPTIWKEDLFGPVPQIF